jgi:hypothetical protein
LPGAAWNVTTSRFLFTHAVVPVMKAQTSGKIVGRAQRASPERGRRIRTSVPL